MKKSNSFIEKLKQSQNRRVNKTFKYPVAEWSETLELRRLTMLDRETAGNWAAKNYREKEEVATGVALVCLSVVGDMLPLERETVDFLLNEPVEVVNGLLSEVNKISKITGV